MPQGVIVTSQGMIIYANPFAFDLFSTNCFLSKNPLSFKKDLIPVDYYASLKKNLAKTVEYDRETEADTFREMNSKQKFDTLTLADYIWEKYKERKHNIIRFAFNDGHEKKIIDASWAEIEEESGKQVSFFLKDWTPIEQLQQEKMNNRLEKIMITTITHELRNPLSGILCMLEQIEVESKNEQVNHYAHVGLKTGKLMMCLVNDILDFTLMEANRLRLSIASFDVGKVIEECIDLFLLEASRKNIEIKTIFAVKNLEKIWSDKSRYMQIVINLLSNAMKFTFAGSIKIKIGYDNVRDYLKTKVIDTGIGILDKDKPLLFKLFGKLERSASLNPSGVGFGLAICQKLAIALGGEIKVKSVYGKGSAFSFYIKNKKPNHILFSLVPQQEPIQANPDKLKKLPSLELLEESPRNKKNTLENLERKQSTCACKKILVVDNDSMNLLMFHSFLSRMHLECDSVFIYKKIK